MSKGTLAGGGVRLKKEVQLHALNVTVNISFHKVSWRKTKYHNHILSLRSNVTAIGPDCVQNKETVTKW